MVQATGSISTGQERYPDGHISCMKLGSAARENTMMSGLAIGLGGMALAFTGVGGVAAAAVALYGGLATVAASPVVGKLVENHHDKKRMNLIYGEPGQKSKAPSASKP